MERHYIQNGYEIKKIVVKIKKKIYFCTVCGARLKRKKMYCGSQNERDSCASKMAVSKRSKSIKLWKERNKERVAIINKKSRQKRAHDKMTAKYL